VRGEGIAQIVQTQHRPRATREQWAGLGSGHRLDEQEARELVTAHLQEQLLLRRYE